MVVLIIAVMIFTMDFFLLDFIFLVLNIFTVIPMVMILMAVRAPQSRRFRNLASQRGL